MLIIREIKMKVINDKNWQTQWIGKKLNKHTLSTLILSLVKTPFICLIYPFKRRKSSKSWFLLENYSVQLLSFKTVSSGFNQSERKSNEPNGGCENSDTTRWEPEKSNFCRVAEFKCQVLRDISSCYIAWELKKRI